MKFMRWSRLFCRTGDKRSAIIEDNVLLTEDGCVLISKRQTALIEIPYRTGEEA